MEREINEFRQTREKQLQEQAVRMRDGIVKEITDVVMEKVKTAQYGPRFRQIRREPEWRARDCIQGQLGFHERRDHGPERKPAATTTTEKPATSPANAPATTKATAAPAASPKKP